MLCLPTFITPIFLFRSFRDWKMKRTVRLRTASSATSQSTQESTVLQSVRESDHSRREHHAEQSCSKAPVTKGTLQSRQRVQLDSKKGQGLM